MFLTIYTSMISNFQDRVHWVETKTVETNRYVSSLIPRLILIFSKLQDQDYLRLRFSYGVETEAHWDQRISKALRQGHIVTGKK